jgi:hypothetical protein
MNARFLVAVLALALAGCDSSIDSPAGGGIAQGSDSERLVVTTAVPPPALHRDRRASWLAHGLSDAAKLLFVSDDESDDVYIFALPAMTLEGTLTGFEEPGGMCVDAAGNVWLANTAAQTMVEYSHAGTLLASLSIAAQYPVGCAINPRNGDLAVASIMDTMGGPGNVEVFAKGSLVGRPYQNPNQYEYFFAAYDGNGNLYVDGFGPSFGYTLSELPARSASMESIAVSGATIYFPGGLSWYPHRKYLIAGDQECNGAISSCEYWLSISGTTATVAGSTPLVSSTGGACDVDQGTVPTLGDRFLGPCIAQSPAPNIAGVWPYSAGGKPLAYSTGVDYPIGSAVSFK